MTPKEKAKNLIEKFSQVASFNDMSDCEEEGKYCAICCVEEIINSRISPSTNYTVETLEYINYWKEVITELNKL